MRSTSKTPAVALLARLLLVGLAAAGCGNVTSSGSGGDPHAQVPARQAATMATCARYQTCDMIGAGKTYATLDSCQTQIASFWDQTWPPAQCDSKIDPAQLNVCLAAIAVADCAAAGTNLVSLLVNCPEAKVCDYAADGGAAD